MILTSVAQTAQEHEIKALFLYNFANFVFWPSSAFESPSSPMRYCAMGHSKVVDTLTNLIDGEQVGSRLLTLQRVDTLDEIKIVTFFLSMQKKASDLQLTDKFKEMEFSQ